jgi:hypothetical protein
MRLLVTSASGTNGVGYGALLAFDHVGRPLGIFSDDARIIDPRGLAVETTRISCSSTAAPTGSWRSIRTGTSFVTPAPPRD